MIAIDKVYPFSDLSKLMDLAEFLYGRGIEFIVTVMPVYDNYELEAFNTYVKVLDYVSKKGGSLFIHCPVENDDGTYNMNAENGLVKAVNEYRARGLNIVGITLSWSKLFDSLGVLEKLKTPFILVTEPETKITSDLDLFKITQVKNKYVIIDGLEVDDFNIFQYKEKRDFSSLQSLYISINDDEKRLLNLIKLLDKERLNIKKFNIEDFSQRLKQFDNLQYKDINNTVVNKSQLELFREEELKKITGENINQEQSVEGYDISWFTRLGIRIAFMVIIVLLLQVLIGRHYDTKKFFKD